MIFCSGEANDDLPGAGRDRPALGEVEVLEGGPVLALEDVLRHDVDADVVLVGHEVEEARRRHLELDDDRVGVGRRRPPATNCWTSTPQRTLRPEVAQRVERVGDVLGAERLAVAPGDAGAGLDRQLLEVGAVLVALGQPQVSPCRRRRCRRPAARRGAGPFWWLDADGVGVPQLVVDPAALAAPPTPGSASGCGRRLAAGRARRPGGQQGGGAGRERPGLDQVAAAPPVRDSVVRHPRLLSSRPTRLALDAAASGRPGRRTWRLRHSGPIGLRSSSRRARARGPLRAARRKYMFLHPRRTIAYLRLSSPSGGAGGRVGASPRARSKPSTARAWRSGPTCWP